MELSTCDLSDMHGDAARVLEPGLVHFGGSRRFHGTVATAECFEDNTELKKLVATPGEGRVIVVDGGGSTRCALLGDMVAGEALANGWAGIVVNGCVRDAAALATMEIGVMALATSPRRSQKNGAGSVNVPVEVLGVRISPDELLVADDDGIVVLDAALAAGPRTV